MREEIELMKTKMDSMESTLEEIKGWVKKMYYGVYGDNENDQPGLVQKQKKIEDRLELIEDQIKKIEDKNKEQDVAIGAKKEQTKDWMKYARRIGKWLVEIIVIFAILKGAVDVDALLKSI